MKRSSFLAVSAAAAATSRAQAQTTGVPGGLDLVEPAAQFDRARFEAAVGRPAAVRQTWEAIGFRPAVLGGIKNSLNGLHFGFGYEAEAIALALAAHGPSSAYTFNEAIWSRYSLGKALKLIDAAGNVLTSNVFLAPGTATTGAMDPNDPHGFYQDTSIATLQKRGVIFLTCHTSVEEHARRLVQDGYAPAGMTDKDVARDILVNLIPGAIVVPAMVAAIAVMQAKFHYTYTSPSY